jgi:hypothetical protein
VRNLRQMRAFYIAWPKQQTLSAGSDAGSPVTFAAANRQTLSADSGLAVSFPLPWSHY